MSIIVWISIVWIVVLCLYLGLNGTNKTVVRLTARVFPFRSTVWYWRTQGIVVHRLGSIWHAMREEVYENVEFRISRGEDIDMLTGYGLSPVEAAHDLLEKELK